MKEKRQRQCLMGHIACVYFVLFVLMREPVSLVHVNSITLCSMESHRVGCRNTNNIVLYMWRKRYSLRNELFCDGCFTLYVSEPTDTGSRFRITKTSLHAIPYELKIIVFSATGTFVGTQHAFKR